MILSGSKCTKTRFLSCSALGPAGRAYAAPLATPIGLGWAHPSHAPSYTLPLNDFDVSTLWATKKVLAVKGLGKLS